MNKSVFCILLHFSFLVIAQDSREIIKIGLLFDHDDPQIKKIFKAAIEIANQNLLVRLEPVIEKVTYADSYEAVGKANSMIREGAVAVFGPSAKNSAENVLEVCENNEIIYFDSRWDFSELYTSSVNLHPHPSRMAVALYHLLTAYEWKSFIVLYESGEYLPIVSELFKLKSNNEFSMSIFRYDLELEGNYRSVLRQIKMHKDQSILIFGSTKNFNTLLKQAQEVGIVTDNYEFIIGNLDYQYFDLQSYRYSGVNMTGFRMFSPDDERITNLMKEIKKTNRNNIYGAFGAYMPDESKDDSELFNGLSPISSDMAFLYDGIQLLAEVINQNYDSRNSIQFFKNGDTFLNLVRTTKANGLTGIIRFDPYTHRCEFMLDVIELRASGLEKIGSWNETKVDNQLVFLDIPRTSTIVEDNKSLANKTFRVITAINPPYAMRKLDSNQLEGNEEYEGFGIELIDKLSKMLGFSYTIHLYNTTNYGGFNITTNSSYGMMKEVDEERADMAISDLTITASRELAVDFTIPFMNLGISILYKKPRREPPKMFSFMDPFSQEVWIYLGAAYIGVSLSLFILGRMSPLEWDNPYPCIEEPDELENQFSFANSLWFSTGALLQQGSEIAPKSASTRSVASIWWFFTLIMVSSYTANLAAFLTIDTSSSPFDNVYELSENKGGVTYGAKETGSTIEFFQNSSDPIYQKMYTYMKSHPDLLVKNNEDGVLKAQQENYAFIMESTSIEYHTERKCDLRQVGGLLDEKGYGIALKKNSPYRAELTNALLELQEAGELEQLTNKWWREIGAGQCSSKTESGSAEKMGLANVSGIYLVTMVGSVIAAFYGILEWIYYIHKGSRRYKTTFKEEFLREVRFAINFATNMKPVKSNEVTYSRNSSVTMDSLPLAENGKNFTN